MKQKPVSLNLKFAALALALASLAPQAHALELDWGGQFWSEVYLIKNYTMDSSATLPDPSRITGTSPNQYPSGYYIPPGGSNTANFETLFLKLQPKIVVNDNISIKTELWAGNPAFGVFGDSYPYTNDQRQYYSTQSRGSVISAQRYWADLTTDFGVVTIGRAPLNWGLGLFWNAGDNLWDRYESTADQIKLNAKFGSFSFSPGIAVYSAGNILGGACSFTGGPGTNLCSTGLGSSGGVTDYFVQLKYENLEEDFEGGLNFVRRIAGGSQDPGALLPNPTTYNPGTGPLNPTLPFNLQSASSLAYNTWDIYAQKKLGKFRLAAEAPITSGSVGGVPYSAFAIAGEGDWRINDTWEMQLRGGRAPGQASSPTATPNQFGAYYFNPDYQIATIMFNYNLVNLGGFLGPNTLNNPTASAANLRSPFDNPITNATYAKWNGILHADKWTFNTAFIWAMANQTANSSSAYFFNSTKRAMEQYVGGGSQGSNLGVEWDLGTGFQWDEYFNFRLDLGAYFPGNYFAFSNSGTANATDPIMAGVFRVGVKF